MIQSVQFIPAIEASNPWRQVEGHFILPDSFIERLWEKAGEEVADNPDLHLEPNYFDLSGDDLTLRFDADVVFDLTDEILGEFIVESDVWEIDDWEIESFDKESYSTIRVNISATARYKAVAA